VVIAAVHRGHAALLLAQVAGRDAYLVNQIPGRFVEFSDVPHHIDMAHMVAVPG